MIRHGTSESRIKLPSLLQYIGEGIWAILKYRQMFPNRETIDAVFCFDPLVFLQAYFFRVFYHAKKIVYYNLDYSKERFHHPFLNAIYRAINIFSINQCDVFLYLTTRIIDDLDPNKKIRQKSFLLKQTVNWNQIERRTSKDMRRLVYAGNIGYSVEFTTVFHALRRLKKEGIVFTLDIYGLLKPTNPLERLVQQCELSDVVSFQGVVETNTLVQVILPQYATGICPYITRDNPKAPDHIFLGTELTAKLVEYAAAGLPIVTTRLYDAFDVIEQENIGFLVKTEEDWYQALKQLLTNKVRYHQYQRNAVAYSQRYDIQKVLAPALKYIFS